MIYASPFTYDGGVFEECEAEVSVWEYDRGVESLPRLKGVANGTVE